MSVRLVAGIDRIEANRSRFVPKAPWRHELQRRPKAWTAGSLEAPHPDERSQTAALGWRIGRGLPEGTVNLLDPSAGVPLHWGRNPVWRLPGSPDVQHELPRGSLVLVDLEPNPRPMKQRGTRPCPGGK